MITPAMFFFVLFLLYPAFKAVDISLHEYSGIGRMTNFIGIRNYVDSLKDKAFFEAILNTLKFTGLDLLFTLSIAFVLAYVMFRKIPGWGFFKTALFIPYITPIIVASLIWRFIYEPNMGTLNTVLDMTGLGTLKHTWLGEYETAFGAVMVSWVWRQFPYHMLILYSAFMKIPEELMEAARIDGAGEGTIVMKIILPSVMPTLAVCMTFIIAMGFRAFDMVWILTQGGPGTTTGISSIFIFTQAFVLNKYGYANAVALEVFAVVGGIVFFMKSRLDRLFGLES